MRNWTLSPGSPLALRIAADARLTPTQYADDQTWELAFGTGDEPAMALQTRYGGRVGLARLVPMFFLGSAANYQAEQVAHPPILRRFAPNYLDLSLDLQADVSVRAEFLVPNSHAVMGRFTLTNTTDRELDLRAELFFQAVRNDQPVKLNLLALEDGRDALHAVNLGGLNPVLLLEGADTLTRMKEGRRDPKLFIKLSVPPHGKVAWQWALVSDTQRDVSLNQADRLLAASVFDQAVTEIETRNKDLLQIETGNADLDAMFAFSQQVLLRNVIAPTQAKPTLVATRLPSRGFSPRGDGNDHNWQWRGVDALSHAIALPSLAALEPALAMQIFRAVMATAQHDGFIDHKVGPIGQRSGWLAAPVLAQTALALFEQTQDQALLRDSIEALRHFFARWFVPAADVDQDGFPEWSHPAQSGMFDHPLFARTLRWAQNAEIRFAESPDLAAHLIREGQALLMIAAQLGEPLDSPLNTSIASRLTQLRHMAESLWATEAYSPRDRDTHQHSVGQVLFRDKAAIPFSAVVLEPANRLIVRIIGGTTNPPTVTITVEGVDFRGALVREQFVADQLEWVYGIGSVVTSHAYSHVQQVTWVGLSRTYEVAIDTVDLNRSFLPDVLPVFLNDDRARRDTLLGRFASPYGWRQAATSDPAYKPDQREGVGAISAWWNAVIINAASDEALDLDALATLLQTLTVALRTTRGFGEYYEATQGTALGDLDVLDGLAPLGLYLRCIGVQIVDSKHVRLGALRWRTTAPLQVSAYGVTVRRDGAQTVIVFATGYRLELSAMPTDWMVLSDPTADLVPPPPAVPDAPTITTALVPTTLPITALVPAGSLTQPPAEQPIRTADMIPHPAVKPILIIHDSDSPIVAPPPSAPITAIPVTTESHSTMEIEIQSQPPSAEGSSASPPSDPSETTTYTIPIRGE